MKIIGGIIVGVCLLIAACVGMNVANMCSTNFN